MMQYHKFLSIFSIVVLSLLEVGNTWADLKRPAPGQRDIIYKNSITNRIMEQDFLQDDYGFDVSHMILEIEVDFTKYIITGKMVIDARAKEKIGTVKLDLYDNMAVTAVKLSHVLADYTRKNDRIFISLPDSLEENEMFTVEVLYNGNPDPSGFGADFFSTHGSYPIFATLVEPEDARAFMPCKDIPKDKFTIEEKYTVPAEMTAVGNGKLEAILLQDGKKTFIWKENYEISTYLVSIAATNYASFSDTYYPADGVAADSMKVVYYVYPEDYEKALVDFGCTVQAIQILADIFGEYPFIEEKYGMAEFDWGGAMEHQTCTSYGSGLIKGNNQYDWIVVHELSHQWWGDMVTLDRWENIWLNEGFASYSEALYYEVIEGREELKTFMEWFMFNYFNEDGKNRFPIYDPKIMFGATVYDKGAWVLHMLRQVMGDANFFDAMKEYGKKFAFSCASTEDFRGVCEEFYGGSLEWFFSQWIYEAGYPELKYNWSAVKKDEPEGYELRLNVNQNQKNAPVFKAPLDLKVKFQDGDSLIRVLLEHKNDSFRIPLSKEPTTVILNPDLTLLCTTKFTGVGENQETGTPSVKRCILWIINHPNPFNPLTQVSFELNSFQSSAALQVFTMEGALVKTLYAGSLEKGVHSFMWDGKNSVGINIASGVYLYVLSTEKEKISKKMILLK